MSIFPKSKMAAAAIFW